MPHVCCKQDVSTHSSAVSSGSSGGKCFLKGEATHPGSQTVPVMLVSLLMVSTFVLRHNLIWMLNRRSLYLGRHCHPQLTRLHFMNLQVPQSSFERKLWSGTSLCSLTVWRAFHGRERSQAPYLVSVHRGDEEGEGNGGGRHGMGRWHSILSNHSLLQLHHRRGGGAGPLQDILGHLANVHHQLQTKGLRWV